MEFRDSLPAKTGKGRQDYIDAAALLKQNPGKWALLEQRASNQLAAGVASRIKTGYIPSFRDGVYEAASRGGDVWVRYVGPK